MQTGIWYKTDHIRKKRLQSFISDIAQICKVNISEKKISNHTGRKSMVQNLQKLGKTKDQIRMQSHHKTDTGLESYILPKSNEQDEMIGNYVDELYSKKSPKESKDEFLENEIDKHDNTKEGFITAKEGK